MFKAALSAVALMAAFVAPLSVFSQEAIGSRNPWELERKANAGDFPHTTPATASAVKTRWSFSFESLYTFHVFPNPWYLAAGTYHQNPRHYHLATQLPALRYQLTDDCGPWFLRGNLELSLGPIGTAVVSGPESYFVGAVLGGRYNFVQRGARLVPYLELRGGAGASDAQRMYQTLQTEFTLTYLIGFGLRFDVNPRYSVTLGITDQHLSNAWFANPDIGFDTVGANLGIQLRY